MKPSSKQREHSIDQNVKASAAARLNPRLELNYGGRLLTTQMWRCDQAMLRAWHPTMDEPELGPCRIGRQLDRSRREEMRRKFLAGAIVLEKVEAGEIEENTLKQWLRPALSKPEDRALFELDA